MNKKWRTSKGAIASISIAGVATVAAAVTVPLVVAGSNNSTQAQQTGNLSVTADSLGIQFSGDEGFGTISKIFDNPNVQFEYSKITNLKNGDKVIVTLTGLNGYLINKAKKVAFEYTVTGLNNVVVINNITVNQEDLRISLCRI